MTRTHLKLVLGLSGLLATAAHARTPVKGEATTVSAEKVEQQVSSLAVARRTPSFEAGFRETVRAIEKLRYSGSPTADVDAQDLALSALHLYLDHKNIDLGSDPATRQAKARAVAAEAGLIALLGW